LITTLITALSEQRDHLRAAAIVADVRLPETGSDAIRATLEHSERIALTVLLPYKPRRFGRTIDYGDLQTGAAAAFHLAELSYFRRRFSRAVAAWPSTGSSRNDSNTS
jgi:hypothetical protein